MQTIGIPVPFFQQELYHALSKYQSAPVLSAPMQGSISVGLTFIHALVSACKPTLADKWAPFLSTLLFLLWIPGAGVITFRGPFIMSGNGKLLLVCLLCTWMCACSLCHRLMQPLCTCRSAPSLKFSLNTNMPYYPWLASLYLFKLQAPI